MLSQKSQSERFVESIYAFSILLLLVMAIAALYITNIVITTVYGTFASLVVLLYQFSFSIIFMLVLALGYVQKRSPSIERRQMLASTMHLVMLLFVSLALFTYSVWTSFPTQLIEVVFFAFLSLIEVFFLEIHNMAFSVPIHGSSK